MNLKNLFLFYILILVPLVVMFIFMKEHVFSTKLFVFFFLFYALIYHPIISGIRLLQSGKINKKQFWYNFIPGWNSRFFSFFFFGK